MNSIRNQITSSQSQEMNIKPKKIRKTWAELDMEGEAEEEIERQNKLQKQRNEMTLKRKILFSKGKYQLEDGEVLE
jgi:Ulp1 family protease